MPRTPRGEPAIGIDFGTSNSAVSFIGPDGLARLVPLEGDATAMPTAVFFNAEDHATYFGREAVGMYLAGVEGRLMRSLKSLLGSSLLDEETAVGSGTLSFRAIITRFLRELRARAGRHLGHEPRRVVLGRPVHFVDDDAARDKRAQEALAQAAAEAGFAHVSFELEPIAAALDYERRMERDGSVLIVDIGGGTSDFTVARLGPGRLARADRRKDILATTGVHIGGTDYDQKLNLRRVMPLLGFGHVGPSGREVPSPTFIDLASWHLIHRMYAPKVVRHVRELRVNYEDTRLHDRLMTVLEHHLGHLLASEVEQAKIRSSVSGEEATIDLSAVEAGLSAAFGPADMAQDLVGLLEQVVDCAQECVERAGLSAAQLDAIYLTGGSSALRPFQALLQERLAGTPLLEGDLFGGVASGLAYASR
ncbi:Hsp70 family protein [Ramlibacter alkalitolerans]|uniref:Hsp70 family protein n=1 Tax=Ramlibacter alkalitolerans TaxID=2039631 RepID=A0ABS1JP86_9BURK|nr:Hsp70 family protein [Ramlibacter alkalitolerans]MBL0426079.1 Hsp70 family protein [Ramlibacter alkalitolerans]